MRGFVFAALLTAAAVFPPVLQAEPLVKKGVSLELVSEHTAIVPGQPLTLGLILRHEPAFHTYWRQPGIVGLAPELRWTLPEGFSAGEILWPEPERTHMAIYEVWGYERDVCLAVPMTAPATLDPKATPSLTFTAKATWMACGETCHPGVADLEITLPVRTEKIAPTEAAPWFAKTRSEQAVADPQWKTSAVYDPGSGFVLSIVPPEGKAVPQDVYFYSYARLVDSNAPQKLERLPDGSARLKLALIESPDEIAETLDGELWSAGGWKKAEDGTVRRMLAIKAQLAALAVGK